MAAFPGSVASFIGFVAGHTLLVDVHASQHNLEQAEIVNTQTKIGTGASTPSNNTVLRGNGTGTSAWAQVTLTTDVSGVLPTANGGTGQANLTNLPLAAPVISGNVTGAATYTNPTLTTPTIADLTNATHTHANAAGGGQLGTTALQTNAVQASQIATNAILIGNTQKTNGDFSTASTTVVQVTGLSVTVTVPAGGRSLEITAHAGALYASGTNRAQMSIWDGTVGSGTQLDEVWGPGVNGTFSAGSANAIAIVTPSAGSKTYNVGLLTNSAGTATLGNSATQPAFITVKVI